MFNIKCSVLWCFNLTIKSFPTFTVVYQTCQSRETLASAANLNCRSGNIALGNNEYFTLDDLDDYHLLTFSSQLAMTTTQRICCAEAVGLLQSWSDSVPYLPL